MNVLYIDAHRGRGYNIGPQREIFKKNLFKKNKNKTQNRGPPWQFCLEILDPPSKNLSYPLPWIFNLCASMVL
jgi:hypothetical protein